MAVIAILMLFLLIMVMPKQRLIQTLTDKLNSVTRESLTGIRVVRAYNAESYQEDKFEKANTDLTQNNLFIGRSFALLTPVMTAVSSGLTLAIYWIGAHLIEDVKIPTDPTKIAGAMENKIHLFFRHGGLFILCHAGCYGIHDDDYCFLPSSTCSCSSWSYQ